MSQWAEFMNLASAIEMLIQPDAVTRQEGAHWTRVWFGSLTPENRQRVLDAIKGIGIQEQRMSERQEDVTHGNN